MSDKLKQIYQSFIIETNRTPLNYHELDDATHQGESYNTLCGDHVKVLVKLNNQTIEKISFTGDCCAIAKSSASLMTEALKEKSKEDATKLFNEFNALMDGTLNPKTDTHSLDKLTIMQSVSSSKPRIKCAKICWLALKEAIDL